MPQLGDILGVIYGTEILQQAAEICIELRRRFIQRTHRTTEICLQDLYDALPFVKDVLGVPPQWLSRCRPHGQSRLLSGSGHLFKCRKGIDLNALFTRNVVFGTRSITDDFATQFLAFHLLWWLHECERSSPSSDRPNSVLIIDDCGPIHRHPRYHEPTGFIESGLGAHYASVQWALLRGCHSSAASD